jgi:hypothetical protein
MDLEIPNPIKPSARPRADVDAFIISEPFWNGVRPGKTS